MIDIQHYTLSALKEYPATKAFCFIEPAPGRACIGEYTVCDAKQVCFETVCIRCIKTKASTKRRVVRNQARKLHVERCFVCQVGNPDRPTTDLVLIGGTNATLGRANLGV